MTVTVTPDDRHDWYKPERALWLAVIERAIRDVFLEDDNPNGTKRAVITRFSCTRLQLARVRDEARLWLLVDNVGFPRVCDLAGVNPDYVRRRVRDMLERGVRATTEPPWGSREAAH